MPRAYADVIGNFRRGEAGAYARNGDYRRASRALAVDDPEMSSAYRRMGQEEEETAYRRGYGQDYAAGDYQAAATRAGKFGDIAGIGAAQQAQSQHSQQEREEAYRELLSYRNELRQIGQAAEAEREPLYQAWATRVHGAAQHSGDQNLIGWVRQNVPTDVYNPRVQGALENQVETLLNQLLTPEQAANLDIRRENEANEGWSLDAYGRPYRMRGGVVTRRNEAGEEVPDTEPVPVPRDRIDASGGDDGIDRRGERDLRREFDARQGNFRQIRDAYAQIQTLTRNPPSASGDVALIFSFMKMLDPTSVVREGEQANAQNATGVPQQVANTYNRLLTGQRLNEQQRNDFVTQARSLYQTRQRQFEQDAEQYRGLASDYGFDPSRIVLDQSTPEAEDGAADLPPLPPLAQRRRGVRYRMSDGGSAEWDGQRLINPQRPGG